MVEGEESQEPSAPEGPATTPDAATDPVAASEAAAPESSPAEQPASEPEAAVAESLSWAHLGGFQAIEPAPESLTAREDYAEQLRKELSARAARFARSVDESIVLSSDGVMRWLGDPVARIVAGETLLAPRPVLLADEALTGEERTAVETRAALWLGAHIRKLLGSLTTLAEGADLPEGAKALGARIAEALGVLERDRVRVEVRSLDQTARGALRKLGVRFGSLYIYVPLLLKPGARGLCTLLWTVKRGSEAGADRLLAFASAGRTSFANEGLLSPDAYRVAGFRLCGERVVRVDIIERLSDLIRAAIPDHMRAGSRPPSEAYGFLVTPQMTSLTGCSGEAFASILRSLGFEPTKVSKAAFEAANRKAPTEPIKPAAVEAPAAAQEATEGVDAVAEGMDREDPPAEDQTEMAAESQEPSPDAVAVEEATPAEPEAEPIEPMAAEPEAASPESAPEAVEAASEAPAPESAGEDEPQAAAEVAPAVDEEIEIWRPAPRRPRAPQRSPRQEHEPRPQHGKPHRRHARPADPAKAAEPAPVEAQVQEGGGRPPRRDDGPRRFEGKPKDERRPQRDFGPRRESRPAPIDPDSPFAKLAALKPLLERRDKRP